MAGLADSTAPAADTMQIFLGPAGRTFIAVGIALSTFGFLNLAICANARVYQAMARDGLFFDAFARLNPRFRTPVLALVAQGAWAAVLVLSDTYGELLDYVVFGDWIFFGLTAATLFYFRRQDALAGTARPEFVTPAWKLSVMLFCAAAAYVVGRLDHRQPGQRPARQPRSSCSACRYTCGAAAGRSSGPGDDASTVSGRYSPRYIRTSSKK